MDAPQAPTSPDAEGREERLSACLSEYHARRAAGEDLDATHFKKRLTAQEYELFDTLLDMDGLLEDPEPSVNNAALPRAFGDYTLLREVGNGATGVVYEGVEQGLRRSVAVKVLRASFGGDNVVRERFLREADACAQIDHPNVVTVHHSGEAEGHPFYAMTFVDGLPLSKMLGSNDLDVRDVCRRAAEVADALGEMHKVGIIHRDVKPGNIMEDPSGRWLLTDFGHVHNDAALTLTKSGDALGTPLYMSPEQARGQRDIDGRTDVYGLGATLYHLITGTPVFSADDVQGLMRAVLMDRAESMQRRMMDVPADLDRVILKCLEKRPEDRYEDMAALAADLRRVAAGRTASGRPVTRTQRILRWIPRHPVRVAAAVLIALGFAWALTRPDASLDAPTLRVATLPGATVAVDGQPDHVAPIKNAIPLQLGDTRFAVSLEGFRSRTIPLTAEAGVKYDRQVLLTPDDPSDLERRDMVLAFAGLVPDDAERLVAYAETVDERSVTRAPESGYSTVALFPRGKVTAAELDRFLVNLGAEIEAGEVSWRHAGKELERTALPDESKVLGDIPETVRKSVKPGDTLEWSVMADGKAVSTARVSIVASTPRLEKGIADLEALGWTGDLLLGTRVKIWLESGFFNRALRALDDAGTENPSELLKRYRVFALEGLCGAKDEQLLASKTWEEAWLALKLKR